MGVTDDGGAMTRTQTLLALAAAFALGCVAAPITAHLLPPAYAQPASVQKWQQFCTFRRSISGSGAELIDPVNRDLQEKGDSGWELTGGIDNGGNILTYCFKRPAS
jgi:hypothetical protein